MLLKSINQKSRKSIKSKSRKLKSIKLKSTDLRGGIFLTCHFCAKIKIKKIKNQENQENQNQEKSTSRKIKIKNVSDLKSGCPHMNTSAVRFPYFFQTSVAKLSHPPCPNPGSKAVFGVCAAPTIVLEMVSKAISSSAVLLENILGRLFNLGTKLFTTQWPGGMR